MGEEIYYFDRIQKKGTESEAIYKKKDESETFEVPLETYLRYGSPGKIKLTPPPSRYNSLCPDL